MTVPKGFTDYAGARRLYGISERQLRHWVSQELITKYRKPGPGRGRVLFRISDLDQLFNMPPVQVA